MAKKERNRGSVDRARAKRATPPNNERRERVGQVLLRNLLDRGETEDTAADFARRSDATSRMNRPPQGMRPAIAGKDFSPRPMPRPSRGSDLAPTSTRDKPVPRPSTVEERAAAERADRAAKREAREAESLMKRAAGGKMKMVRKGDEMVPAFAADGVGKMREGGGVCRGMGAATKGGNFRMG
jgi:hypothetical protein